LEVVAAPQGAPGDSRIVVQYRVTNHGTAAKQVGLWLALRPFQVNPPTQFLNQPGGTARIFKLRQEERQVTWNDDKLVMAFQPISRFGALRGDDGDVVEDYLAAGEFPKNGLAVDSTGAASRAIGWDLN